MKISGKNLYRKTKAVDQAHWKEVVRQAKLMLPFMRASRGIGLSANQVGIGRSFFVMDCGKPRIVINPEIVEAIGDEVFRDMEGCLSFPEQFCLIDRPVTISVKYYNEEGNVVEETLTGLEARCFQHEYDHLQGVVMFERDYRRVK